MLVAVANQLYVRARTSFHEVFRFIFSIAKGRGRVGPYSLFFSFRILFLFVFHAVKNNLCHSYSEEGIVLYFFSLVAPVRSITILNKTKKVL